MEDDGSEVLIYGEEKCTLEGSLSELEQVRSNNEWTDAQSVMLLDLYEEYLPLVGPLKRFKTKRIMWNKLAEIINQKLKCNKTAVQAENRYKTILKRKKNAVDNNRKSGAERMEIPYEKELNKIACIDDSVEPEVMGTASGITIIKKCKDVDGHAIPSTSTVTQKQKVETIQEKSQNVDGCATPSTSRIQNAESTPRQKRKVKTIQETLWEIHEKKEESKERRHKEKLDFIKKLFVANDEQASLNNS